MAHASDSPSWRITPSADRFERGLPGGVLASCLDDEAEAAFGDSFERGLDRAERGREGGPVGSRIDDMDRALLAVARAQGVNGGAWLDQLEAQFSLNTKNMTFSGCRMEDETAAVEAALTNLKAITTAMRAQAARAGQPKPHGNAASR